MLLSHLMVVNYQTECFELLFNSRRQSIENEPQPETFSTSTDDMF